MLSYTNRATFARATRVDIHSIFVLGPSVLGKGKITSENGNLMNLRYTKMKFDNIIFGISAPDYPSRTVESNSLLLFWISIYLVYFIFI